VEILMATLGTAGDVHPFVVIGRALRERGHEVTLATNGFFEDLVKGAGIGFVELGTRASYEAMLRERRFWMPGKATGLILKKVVLPFLAPLFEIIAGFDRQETVVVASTLAFGARAAQEKLGVPLVTVHLQPACFMSFDDPPVNSVFNIPAWVPKPLRRTIWSTLDLVWNGVAGREINSFLASLGLPRRNRILTRWINSPGKVIGLFPEWFASPAPDWPSQTVLTGFVGGVSGTNSVPEELESFLMSGDPPLAVMPGTGNAHATRFMETVLESCRLLGRRAVLVTQYRENVPPSLPEGATHVGYAPSGALLPRCAGLVHHGGIGTSAAALHAGIPQLVIPINFDQPDNAARLQRLGVADFLLPKRLSGSGAAKKLATLMGSPEVRKRCRDLAGRIDFEDALERARRAIEHPLSGGNSP
jgi:rhamnosyltransferase subunit B